VSGDGCSRLCVVEAGYQCLSGVYPYSAETCIPICGDGIVVAPETCDFGTLNAKNGCSSTCQLLNIYCGNGIKEASEQCDDGNNIDADGCSAVCQIEVGWSCHLAVGAFNDICSECSYQCSNCLNNTIQGCTQCFSGYYIHYPNDRCEPTCPTGYFVQLGACASCTIGCTRCFGTSLDQCTQCDSTHFFLAGKCLNQCDEGYFN